MATTIAHACYEAVQEAIGDDAKVISRKTVAELHPLVVEKVRETFALHRHEDIEEAKLWATRELMTRATWLLTLTTRCGCSKVVEYSSTPRRMVVPLKHGAATTSARTFFEDAAELASLKFETRSFEIVWRNHDPAEKTATYEEVE